VGAPSVKFLVRSLPHGNFQIRARGFHRGGPKTNPAGAGGRRGRQRGVVSLGGASPGDPVRWPGAWRRARLRKTSLRSPSRMILPRRYGEPESQKPQWRGAHARRCKQMHTWPVHTPHAPDQRPPARALRAECALRDSRRRASPAPHAACARHARPRAAVGAAGRRAGLADQHGACEGGRPPARGDPWTAAIGALAAATAVQQLAPHCEVSAARSARQQSCARGQPGSGDEHGWARTRVRARFGERLGSARLRSSQSSACHASRVRRATGRCPVWSLATSGARSSWEAAAHTSNSSIGA